MLSGPKYEPELVESGGRHLYVLDGVTVPSVTTVIDSVYRMQELERWRGVVGNKEADQRRDDAAELGTRVHRACVLAMEGVEDLGLGMSDAEQRMVDAFRAWHEANVERVLSVERMFTDLKLGYGGTSDELAWLKGDSYPAVVDIKTGRESLTWRMQTAAYREAWRHVYVGKERPQRRLVVALSKDEPGALKVHEFTQHAADFAAFLNALSLYRWKEAA